MIFNSVQFLIFFVIVYSLYLKLPHKGQNRMLLVASYIFYGAWDWRFLSLIILSTIIDYYCGIFVHESKEPQQKKRFVTISMLSNLMILLFFKYFNFFAANLQGLLNVFGLQVPSFYLDIILPMGISFYTFQTMSYTIDIYRRELKPTRNFLDFALFVSFYPQLVAGPIERAKHLLPQILNPRKVNLESFYEGMFLMFWGLFQKVVIADNLAQIVDPLFIKNPPYNGVAVYITMVAFTFQIYCDFAGYSNIARGLGKVMGFDIMINFNLPFFVTNIQDYWNRWHISLSSWIRDYLYVPLFKYLRKVKGQARIYSALMISMTLIGLWHGASWNFVIFGVYYGLLLVAYVIIRSRCHSWIQPKSVAGKSIWHWTRVIFMFHLIMIGMLLFRVQYGAQIYLMLKGVFLDFQFLPEHKFLALKTFYFIWILLLVQFFQYFKKDLLCVYRAPFFVRVAFYLICFFLITIHGVTGEKEFIYFQF